MKKLITLLLTLFCVSTFVFAHPGRTDSRGGHYNRSTGVYHYHHGYPEHQHTNGICPYDYDDKTNSSSSSSNSSKKQVANADEREREKITIGEIITNIVLFVLFGIPYMVGIIGAVLSIIIIPITNLWDWLKKKFNKK